MHLMGLVLLLDITKVQDDCISFIYSKPLVFFFFSVADLMAHEPVIQLDIS